MVRIQGGGGIDRNHPNPRWRAFPLIPLFIGFAVFLIFCHPKILLFTNITWFEQDDPKTYYLGWQFFRSSPWTFPVGLNPNYGLEISNGIVFSDSIPIVAIALKPFSSFLPETFQYFGAWVLFCCVLQALFAWKLTGLATRNSLIRGLATGLFTYSHPFLCRTAVVFSMAAQFLVLAALYLCLKRNSRFSISWLILLAFTSMTNGYLLLMVGALWYSDLVSRAMEERANPKLLLYEFIAVFSTLAFVLWQAGYFSVGGSYDTGDYGIFRMHLLGLLDPRMSSSLIGAFPSTRMEAEGFNYLGLGGIFGLFCASIYGWKNRKEFFFSARKFPALFLTLLLLSLIALSHRIGFGSFNFTLDVPTALLKLTGPFRAAGRMFLPAFYSIVFSIVFIIARYARPSAAISILGFALFLQIADSGPGISMARSFQSAAPGSRWPSPLKDRFWEMASKKYKKIRFLKPGNSLPDWHIFASYASQKGMATDTVYLGRMSQEKLSALAERANEMTEAWSFERDTLYILDKDVFAKLHARRPKSPELKIVDGYTVLAPI